MVRAWARVRARARVRSTARVRVRAMARVRARVRVRVRVRPNPNPAPDRGHDGAAALEALEPALAARVMRPAERGAGRLGETTLDVSVEFFGSP